jgi:hypothetical protein
LKLSSLKKWREKILKEMNSFEALKNTQNTRKTGIKKYEEYLKK